MNKRTLLFFLMVTTISYSHSKSQFEYDPTSLIVKLKQGHSFRRGLLAEISDHRPLIKELNIHLVEVHERSLLDSTIEKLKNSPDTLYVQRNHFVSLRQIPNDPDFPRIWSLNTTPQHSDISIHKVWDHGVGGKDALGRDVVVAVVDGGMDLAHMDLKDNLWVNIGEIPGNGIDDDHNGYIDDINGWNGYLASGSIPVNDHGTHVAGTIGAKGNNGQLVSGINWNVKIMPIAASSRQTSVILEGYGYALAQKKLFIESNGAKGANVVVTNSSFGVDYANCESEEFPAWNDIYNTLGQYGILSVAATINSDVNVDEEGDVPTGCSTPYIIGVTNLAKNKKKYQHAGFGKQSIDLAAPGTNILSTIPDNNIGQMTGTSMSAPHVSGSIALLYSLAPESFHLQFEGKPNEGALKLKSLILENVSKDENLSEQVLSGGHLNVEKAYQAFSH